MRFTFRRLAPSDLALIHGWLNEPGVVRWWEGDDVSEEAVVRDYVEDRGAEHWIAAVGGTEVGWVQCWPVAAEVEECAPWLALGVHRTAAGIDYLVGDPARRGRGLGAAMLRAFVTDVVFGRHPAYTQVCAAPYRANEASWKALRNAGFRLLGTVHDKDGPCQLMVADRAGWPAGDGQDAADAGQRPTAPAPRAGGARPPGTGGRAPRATASPAGG